MRVINFDQGSKRRLRQIRWTSRERTSVVLLSLVLLALCMLVEIWYVVHEHPFSEDGARIIRSTSK